MRVFRAGLKDRLDEGEKVQADKGYIGEDGCFVPQRQTEEERELSRKVHAHHETVNHRMKRFTALRATFRHELTKHPYVFRVAATLVQLAIERGEILYQVDYVE